MWTDDICDFLIAKGYATAVGVDLFVTQAPPLNAGQALDCVLLVPTPGRSPENVLDGTKTITYEYPRFQIQRLTANYDAGEAAIDGMKADLFGVINQTLAPSGDFYLAIEPQGDWFTLPGTDGTGRLRFVLNVEISKQRA